MNAVVKPTHEPEAERFAPMTLADLDDVLRIETAVYAFPWTRGNFEDGLRAGYCAWTLRGLPGGRRTPMIAYAVVMIVIDEAHLLNLSVAADCQRAGYGWRMLEWMAQQARDHGARSMLLEVRPSNLSAQQLYERYGFARIGIRRGYYPAQDGREDALVMRIAL
ncbi:MAG: ribosomal protein S18-alanine N-acetyltransferase [Burkholderiaceae bacterium]|nr:ribosomal protein S18-alanine N-acetyltransferase [Burkholderiaceae bacterium]